ncbi:MAG: T9SS type A sorting domain-containing protein [Candidatus Kapaibacterium sp.]
MIQFVKLLLSLIFVVAAGVSVRAQTVVDSIRYYVFSNGTTEWGTIGQSITGISQEKDSVGISAGFWFTLENNPIPSPNDGESISIKDISPNPASDQTTIYIVNPTTTEQVVTLTVFDASGREIAVVLNGSVKQGETSIRFETKYAPTGTYFCRLVIGDKKQILQFDIVK